MLRGISIKEPAFYCGTLPSEFQKVRGYMGLQTFFPTLVNLNSNIGKVRDKEVWIDHTWKIVAMDLSGGTGVCNVKIQRNTGANNEPSESRRVFLKVTHLLDPIHWIRGEYSLPKDAALPGNQRTWATAWKKLHEPCNQAYIESVASYALGRLAEEGITPHFNHFYGSFCAKASTYRYNLTEDFYSYRDERWFWKGYDNTLFKLSVRDRKNPNAPVPERVQQYVFDADIDNSSSISTDLGEQELENIVVDSVKEGSIHSADSMRSISFENSSSLSSSSGLSSDMSNILEAYEVYAEMSNYPVMLIFTQMNEGTMEDLLTNFEEVGASPGMVEWEERWTAWLFQIIAALVCAQKVIGFTHNDLHTNNIVWTKTEEEFLYYRTGAGVIYRVPTFGKIFKIIDFGRAIFTVNETMYISDDFKEDNDAGEQYAFSPLCDKYEKEVPPNPSFDLCRLAVSLLGNLFPLKPDEIEDGNVLSKEKGLVVKETVSELYNLLWSFMIDDEGKNVFINPDESERFPNFDLYKHIAEWVHVAVPAEQVGKAIFRGFVIGGVSGEGKRVYPLFL